MRLSALSSVLFRLTMSDAFSLWIESVCYATLIVDCHCNDLIGLRALVISYG